MESKEIYLRNVVTVNHDLQLRVAVLIYYLWYMSLENS